MREAQIILPQTMTAQPAIELRKALLATFGGYTEHVATGAWRDPATEIVHRDHHTVFTVAGEPRQWHELAGAAIAVGRMAKQVCIYARDFDGFIHFLDCKEI